MLVDANAVFVVLTVPTAQYSSHPQWEAVFAAAVVVVDAVTAVVVADNADVVAVAAVEMQSQVFRSH